MSFAHAAEEYIDGGTVSAASAAPPMPLYPLQGPDGIFGGWVGFFADAAVLC